MTDFAYAPQTAILPSSRSWETVRYGGVLVIWLGLTLAQPKLGLEILRQRRPDSPLRRRSERRIPSQIAKTHAPQAF